MNNSRTRLKLEGFTMKLEVITQNAKPVIWALAFFIVCCGIFVLSRSF